jgi:hypothetical protein
MGRQKMSQVGFEVTTTIVDIITTLLSVTIKTMELYVIIVLVLLVLVFGRIALSSRQHKRKVFKNNTYTYTAKSLPMTRTEADFYIKLQTVVDERYYVFPQVHLSALLDYKLKGQDWHYAFRHINGKSVDYVLCDKETLRPTYAIELDDFTHHKADRKVRDAEVERIFADANLPLVRFKSANVSSKHIVSELTKAHNSL